MHIESTNAPLPANVALRPDHLQVPLDARAVAAEIARSGLALDHSVPPRQFAGGLANLNYLIRLENRWAVLRRPPSGPLPPGANDMAREHRILSRLWQALPLAPRSLHLCTDPSVIEVPFQILEFRGGLTLRGASLAPLLETPQIGRALSVMLVETLAQVHAVSPEAVELGSLGRPEGFFHRQVKGWLGRAVDVAGGDLPATARQIADWLEACPPPQDEGPVLLHSDFKLDNLLLDSTTLRATTLVDWDMGTRGPAMFDLATMLSYWTEPGDPPCMHRLAQMPTSRPGFTSREEAATAYARQTARSIDDIRPWRVLTVLKLAVVFLQLHRRHVTGETADPRYATFGGLGTDLYAFALDIARGRLF
ncbi:phosphotransferase family protein [Aquamicrobium sp. LC103]|uniref:phosphotransferase family protein n=1 Tax=Aquamicrobium sp. LC103 TaxID=1120658 RepID=UPI00069991DF|nr:phosphotransferase family protein [Aquamicrobium sp. LC103]TKT69811.1 phosphotransferase family protein [Aquamicrobium sp. LC103]